jgi:hypothetical protein
MDHRKGLPADEGQQNLRFVKPEADLRGVRREDAVGVGLARAMRWPGEDGLRNLRFGKGVAKRRGV